MVTDPPLCWASHLQGSRALSHPAALARLFFPCLFLSLSAGSGSACRVAPFPCPISVPCRSSDPEEMLPPRVASWQWGLLLPPAQRAGQGSSTTSLRWLQMSSGPLSLVTQLLVGSQCHAAPARAGCCAVPSLILPSFGALVSGQRWSWVRGLTPISRAGSHRTLLSNSSRSSVFKTSSKNHQERERQARSFPLPTNSNGAGVMDSHQRACRRHGPGMGSSGPGVAPLPQELPAPGGAASSRTLALIW